MTNEEKSYPTRQAYALFLKAARDYVREMKANMDEGLCDKIDGKPVWKLSDLSKDFDEYMTGYYTRCILSALYSSSRSATGRH